MLIINKDKCTGCKICETDCPSLSINISDYSIASSCIECMHCVAICPHNAIYDENFVTEKNEPLQIEPDQIKQLFYHNRSVRNYTDKEISKETIKELISSISLLPSASNRRDIELTIVYGKEKVKELNNDVAANLIAYFSKLANPIINIFLIPLIGSKDASKIKYYKDTFIKKSIIRPQFICFNAPVTIIFHAKKTKVGLSEADSYIWATQLTNYAKSMGISACFIGFIEKAMNRDSKLKQKYKIPHSHKVYASLVMGYSNVKYINKIQRKSPNFSIIE